MLKILSFSIDNQKADCRIGTENPEFSWQSESDINDNRQKSYRLVVKSGAELFWDSGLSETEQSFGIKYGGKALLPNSVYEISLYVESVKGEKAQYMFTAISGKLSEKWRAHWLTNVFECNTEAKLPPDIFRKKFNVRKGLKRAVLYSSALGVYRASLNKEWVSEDLNAPGFTSYSNRVQYQMYDVMPFIKEGQNELRAIVSDGWYRGRIVNIICSFGSRTGFICELHLFYDDGTHDVIFTDKSWKWTGDGPLRFSQNLDGDIYDATMEDESKWTWHEPMYLWNYELPKKIEYQNSPLVRRHEKYIPTPVDNAKGEFIYDFGANFAGCVEFEVNAPRGTVVDITHGEELEVGNYLYTMNLTNCRQQVLYTCKGDGWEKYSPYFTSMGFRYIKVAGLQSRDQIKICAYARYSDLEKAGEFKCSYEKLNKLQSNIVRTQKSNFQDVPSDCPQRYERMGWTGDFAAFSRTAVMNLDTHSFAKKWLADLILDQRPSGSVPWIIPNTRYYDSGREQGCCGWADAAVIVPWVMYMTYGDKALLERQYGSMKKWVERERRSAAWDSKGYEKYIWDTGYHFGDWLMPYTWYMDWYRSAKWLATLYFANSANLLSRSARILGKEADAVKYEKLFKNISKAFCKKFMKKDGTINTEFQGVLVCALAFGVLDEKQKETVSKQLLADIESRDGCLSSGVLSVAYILDSLSENGNAQTALDLLFNEKMPSWLYMVNNGATSMWETWNGLSDYTTPVPEGTIGSLPSHNHYYIGAVGDWMYKNIGGLKIDEENPGYKHFFFEPMMCKKLDFASVTHESPYGLISLDWKKKDGKFSAEICVPFNSSVTVKLPDGSTKDFGSGKHSISCNIAKEYN